ncbi:DUF2254 family protein [Candidatus Viadribacter manganicus]|uniref:DUF2254 domain-containing protein n=1 Tax=Candidatus Viadribacter manganicus TaxID=1759059 RepID=A0A1B1ADK0_9PROT|nr:DUF2254 family protein [Candidatus Viadribacter manganicus]ANP44632.1 hypothetical protein ATE48_01200 [Candidatus Viadribacter manganicus]
MHNGDGKEAFRMFAMRAAILACSAVGVFWLFYIVDFTIHAVIAGKGDAGANPFVGFFSFDPPSVNNPVSALTGINAAVFGIVITVCSIIVQLTADRYTGVAGLFLRDRTNMMVAGYYVVTCVLSLWLSASLQPDYIPPITVMLALSLTTGGIVLMVPYFAYVFWFLEPQNLIARIRKQALEVAGRGALLVDERLSSESQVQIIEALEELTDITSNSISGKDKIIASAAVDALRDMAIEYIRVKPDAAHIWFTVGDGIRLTPDFVAMDPESLRDLEARHTWVEWKVLRQYLSIYNESLGAMRDINYLIAIDTRYIGEAAAKAQDEELVQLVFRFMNSYIRATLNARDVRTTYNVLNQYRKLGEFMLMDGHHEAALDCVRHIKYYGLVAFDMDLHFVTETVAHDMSTLAQLSNQVGSTAEKEILHEFLELDRPPFVRGTDKALMGVRKAQVKLAAYYILTEQEERARAIADDMRAEPLDRLQLVRRQLENVANKDFWEITDRGRNFEYMPPKQRACLETYFAWLGIDGANGKSAAPEEPTPTKD